MIDTHAGEGAYDLFSDEAERTGEWRGGVGGWPTLRRGAESRELLAPYIEALGPFVDGRPRLYPGSPLLAQRFLRENDRAIFCELREDAFAALRRRFARDKRVKTINLDGYTATGAFVPPVERRGLVLIDPPFEQPNEFRAMFAAFRAAYRKWPTGIYVLWHPVKDLAQTKSFLESFREVGIRRVLRIELCVGGAGERLNRAGLVIVNPPFGFEGDARALLPFLAERLARGRGRVCRGGGGGGVKRAKLERSRRPRILLKARSTSAPKGMPECSSSAIPPHHPTRAKSASPPIFWGCGPHRDRRRRFVDPADSIRVQDPLGKIPVLMLEDGSSLYDSRVIAEYLDYLDGGDRLFQPIPRGVSRRCDCRRSATGFATRPCWSVMNSPRGRKRCVTRRCIELQQGKIDRALKALEAAPPQGVLDIGHIALATALGYLDLRFQGSLARGPSQTGRLARRFRQKHAVLRGDQGIKRAEVFRANCLRRNLDRTSLGAFQTMSSPFLSSLALACGAAAVPPGMRSTWPGKIESAFFSSGRFASKIC